MFTILSRALPMRTNASPVKAIMRPGGTIHHQRPLDIAPAAWASCRILPHVGIDGSPRPRKDNAALG